MSLRVRVPGACGQLGADLGPTLGRVGHVFAPAGRDEVNAEQTRLRAAALEHYRLRLFITCAAYNNVNRSTVGRAACRRVNAGAPAMLGRAAANRYGYGSVLHFSTNLVFDGRNPAPYTRDDRSRPLFCYGRCKLEDERELLPSRAHCMVLRASWRHAHCNFFFRKLMLLGATRAIVRVTNDQVGCPRYTTDVANALTMTVEALLRAPTKHHRSAGRASITSLRPSSAFATRLRARSSRRCRPAVC